MSPTERSPWPPRLATLLLWMLAGACAVFWVLRLAPPSGANRSLPPSVAAGGALADGSAGSAAVSRLLGSVAPTVTTVAAAPATASRFGLIGIVANRSNGGVAVISVDGKPAKPFQVGSKIDDNLILQAVAARRADIGVDAKGPPVFTLELAPLKK